jgi:hypothetical protein
MQDLMQDLYKNTNGSWSAKFRTFGEMDGRFQVVASQTATFKTLDEAEEWLDAMYALPVPESATFWTMREYAQ